MVCAQNVHVYVHHTNIFVHIIHTYIVHVCKCVLNFKKSEPSKQFVKVVYRLFLISSNLNCNSEDTFTMVGCDRQREYDNDRIK